MAEEGSEYCEGKTPIRTKTPTVMEEQAQLQAPRTFLPQRTTLSNTLEYYYNVPSCAVVFIEHWMDLGERKNVRLVESTTDFQQLQAERKKQHGMPLQVPGNIIAVQRLNDVRYINKFMESANANLPLGGRFIGSLETAEQRRDRILKKYPKNIRMTLYSLDYLIRRVWPKLPCAKKIYFALTRGSNRVVSKIEMYGRIYSCGFELLDVLQLEDRLYFVAQKTGTPAYNTEATYGPLVKLKRQGKNKMIRVYKIRTMYPYSEYLQQYVFDHNGLESGGKMKNDPRVNAVGRFLRKYWLDELPMLFNVLKGDLKLFGVRPISAQYLSLYPKEFQEFRKKFRPGFIPPYYADLPHSFEEILESERQYLTAYQKAPFRTDLRYFLKALHNIIIKRVRSH
jgi:lipopolysaccharide/colanic/teichoic acid biosynthesis glycosyltransferase